MQNRVLATSTFIAVCGLWAFSRRIPHLSLSSKRAIHTLLATAMTQVTLGISALIYFVPIQLAAAHQAGSLTLLSVAIWLVHTLRRIGAQKGYRSVR